MVKFMFMAGNDWQWCLRIQDPCSVPLAVGDLDGYSTTPGPFRKVFPGKCLGCTEAFPKGPLKGGEKGRGVGS